MSFFGKLKSAATPQSASATPHKKDPNAPHPTPLEKHLADVTGPVRPDGSDKFFGFENYGSTCYCNSIIQCLYYSAPFREHVMNFPSQDFITELANGLGGDHNAITTPRSTSTTPYPNPTSPARKEAPPTSPTALPPKPEDSKDSPENKKKQAIKSGPVLAMTDDNSNKYFMDESLFTSLREIFEAIITSDSRTGVVSPHRFLEILRRENEMFRSAMHQDAHEFLNLLLNQVVDNVEMFSKQHPNRLAPPQLNGSALEMGGSSEVVPAKTMANGLDTHWVHDLFEGLLTSETRCLTCENTSQRDEAFLDLSVDLEAHTSVTSCLRKFSEEEMLCERNKFHCDNCGGLQEAEKRMKIKRLPRILALHLKRFKYTEDLQRLQKVFYKVVYPFHLRLFNTADETDDQDRIYELYSVVVHIGGGPYHGHYVSIVKTEDRGWLLFDDELVEPVDRNFVLSFFGGEPVPGLQDAKQLACAYVLFYQETTLEAVLREQELEGQRHASAPVAARTSDVDAAKDLFTPPSKDPHTNLNSATTPLHEDLEHMDHLAHAVTAPALGAHASTADDLTNTPTFNPVMPVKTKKELKAEEKERRAKEKADKKLEEQNRKEASETRMKVWREQNEQYKRTLEESKATAAEEAKNRGEEPPSAVSATPDKTTGLARFRTGSMSLRGKPKFFGGRDKSYQVELQQPKDAVSASNGGLASVPQGQELTDDASGNGDVLEKTTSNHALTAAVSSPPPTSQTPEDKKKIRHRFSLSRKKSQAM